MENDLLSTIQAAQRLAISTTTMYQWLADSDAGTLVIRGQQVRIGYLQGGPKGQGRIKIEAQEIERLKDLMRVQPSQPRHRCPPRPKNFFPGITVELGRPD
ncbi:MAG: DNA-binding protein [Planctomycetaceae bacterium]|nr:DNA-binding protein [Planctomycetaceae bacterium]